MDKQQTNQVQYSTPSQAVNSIPFQNLKLGSMAKDLGPYASTSFASSKAKKNKLSKKIRDALKKGAKNQMINLTTDHAQPDRYYSGNNGKQSILVNDHAGEDTISLNNHNAI